MDFDYEEGPYFLEAGSPGNARFGKLMKQLRRTNGIMAKDLAKTVGVSVSYISMIEHGDRVPSLDVARKILDPMPIKFGPIVWSARDEYDLLLQDPENESYVAFKFKHEGGGRGPRGSGKQGIVMDELQGTFDIEVVGGKLFLGVAISHAVVTTNAIPILLKGRDGTIWNWSTIVNMTRVG